MKLNKIVSYLGGLIVFVGLFILVWQNWETMGFISRISSTLVAGVVFYVSGLLFARSETTREVGYALHLTAGLLIPIGAYVLVNQGGYEFGRAEIQSIVSLTLLIIYLVSLLSFRYTVFAIFTLIFGTWFFFASTKFLIGGNIDIWGGKFYEYRSIVIGITYILLGHYFSSNYLRSISRTLFFLGSFIFLAASLALGGFGSDKNLFWEIIYPVLIAGMIFLSITLRRTSLLVNSSIFLVAYTIKMTIDHFAGSMSWPLALVIGGLLVIAVAYFSRYINLHYIKQSTSTPNGPPSPLS